MGFAQWFWRLFLVFAGLIAAHVLIVTLLVTAQARAGASIPLLTTQLWVAATIAILLGVAAIWYCVRRIVEPLAELSRQVRSAAAAGGSQPGLLDQDDEVGLLTGAFDQMQRDLARRLDQIQDHSQRLATVLSNMTEGVLAV